MKPKSIKSTQNWLYYSPCFRNTPDCSMYFGDDRVGIPFFYNTSEWAALLYKQMDFPSQKKEYKFPKELLLVVKQKIKEPLFDHTEYHSNVKIASKDCLLPTYDTDKDCLLTAKK